MYTERQLDRMLGKLKRLEEMLEPRLFAAVDAVPLRAFQTDGRYHSVPEDGLFAPCEDGTVFEGEGIYCWFKGCYTVPEELDGKRLFICPHVQGYEGMLWVNGKPYGNFAAKIIENSHGNHYCQGRGRDRDRAGILCESLHQRNTAVPGGGPEGVSDRLSSGADLPEG